MRCRKKLARAVWALLLVNALWPDQRLGVGAGRACRSTGDKRRLLGLSEDMGVAQALLLAHALTPRQRFGVGAERACLQ